MTGNISTHHFTIYVYLHTFSQDIIAYTVSIEPDNQSNHPNLLILPTVFPATEESLSYFKAHLIASGDQFRFQSRRKFPIFTMEVGKNYVQEFIMKQGHGLYLEYHNEPHFHQPMNSCSRYLSDPIHVYPFS